MTNEHHEAASNLLDDTEPGNPSHDRRLHRAQVEATLAVAHELHTANLIAMTDSVGGAIHGARKEALDLVRRRELSEEKALDLFADLDKREERVKAVQKTVRGRMGLPE